MTIYDDVIRVLQTVGQLEGRADEVADAVLEVVFTVYSRSSFRETTVCPICGKPSKGVHMQCARQECDKHFNAIEAGIPCTCIVCKDEQLKSVVPQ